MSIGESHATLGEPVEIWRVDFGFGVVAGYVAIAHVISKNQNDIGGGYSRSRSQAGYQKGAECKFGFHSNKGRACCLRSPRSRTGFGKEG